MHGLIRSVLKRCISPWWLKRLRDLEKWRRARRKGSWRLGWGEFVLNGVQVLVKERIDVVGRLDYPRAEIFMAAASAAQLTRMNACAKEPETVAWLETHLRPADVLYDVGAHVGGYALIAAARAPEGSVFAFEPNARLFAALVRNLQLNNWRDRVVALPVALGARTEAGMSLTYRLDELRNALQLPAPTLLKIDVDGEEATVLQGARETLREPNLRTLLVEIEELPGAEPEALGLVTDAGFRVLAKHPRGKGGSRTTFNYVFARIY
ncbi:MAG: FkbM family methyltransferase [bacterium]|nr:FkbM family methyltransferase [bacterium]MDZ4296310.1 FkbM family methyltransferase [Patescibacteria group bacterium]